MNIKMTTPQDKIKFNPTVSYFTSAVQVPVTGTIKIEDIFETIKNRDIHILKNKLKVNKLLFNDKYAKDNFINIDKTFDQIEYVKTLTKGTEEYKKRKIELPVFTPHSYSSIDGKNENIEGYTNLLFFDVDEKMTPKEDKIFLDYLYTLPYIYAIGYSSSNKYHIFIKADFARSTFKETTDIFTRTYFELLQEMTVQSGLNRKLFDTAVCNLGRKAIMSNNIFYINPDATFYNFKNTSIIIANKIKEVYNLKNVNEYTYIDQAYIDAAKKRQDEINKNKITEKVISSDNAVDYLIKTKLSGFYATGSTDYNKAGQDLFNKIFFYDIDENELSDIYFNFIPRSTETENTFNKLYSYYSKYSSFGTKPVFQKTYTIEHTIEPINTELDILEGNKTDIQPTIHMGKLEKLNIYKDLIDENSNKLILLADTKLGKTRTMIDIYTKKRGITVITVPTRPLCNDIYNKMISNKLFNKSEVQNIHSGKKVECNTSVKLYITTYDSFNKILSEYEPSDINLIVDELHTFIDDYDYRKRAIDTMVNYLNTYTFRNTTVMTGTLMPEFDLSVLKSYKQLEFRYADNIKNNIHLIESIKKTEALHSILKNELEKGNNVLIHNNFKLENERLKKSIEDTYKVKVKLIDRKNNDLILDEERVFIVTNTFNIGIELKVKIDTMIIKTDFNNQSTYLSKEQIIQIMGRDDRENASNTAKDIYIINNFNKDNTYTSINDFINKKLRRLEVLDKDIDQVRKTKRYEPIITDGDRDASFDFIDKTGIDANGKQYVIEGNKMVLSRHMYRARSEYQYIDKEYFIELFSDNYFNIVNESDDIQSSDYKKTYSKKDIILLNQSIQKIKTSELRPYSTYTYIDKINLSETDSIISKLIDDIDFKSEFRDLLILKGYKDFIYEFTQYKNLKSISTVKSYDNDNDKSEEDMLKELYTIFYPLINNVNNSTTYTFDRLIELFRKTKIFNNLGKRDFLPKLKEWIDIKVMPKIDENDLTKYQLIYPINELTLSDINIIYPSEYLTKEELYNYFNTPQYRTLFNTATIESFFKSLKDYTKTKGLKLDSKKTSVNGVKLYKYIIN